MTDPGAIELLAACRWLDAVARVSPPARELYLALSLAAGPGGLVKLAAAIRLRAVGAAPVPDPLALVAELDRAGLIEPDSDAPGEEPLLVAHWAFWRRLGNAPGTNERWVYLAQAGGVGGPVKIGCTGDIDARLKSLQTANAREVRLLGALPGDERLERRLHAVLDGCRLRGEWFSPAPQLVSLCVALGLQPPLIATIAAARDGGAAA